MDFVTNSTIESDTMKISVQKLNINNCSQATAIYNYYVENTTATYATIPVSEAEFVDYYKIGNEKTVAYRYFADGTEAGFGLLKPYDAKKQAFDKTYEITLYLHKDFCGKGLGKEIVAHLEERAKELGLVTLISIISTENTESCRLFEKCGYELCGHVKKAGIKFERFLGLYFYQKILEDMDI